MGRERRRLPSLEQADLMAGYGLRLFGIGETMKYFGLALALLLAACTSSVKLGPQSVAGLTPDGTVDMNEVQAAFVGSAGGGTGTLYYQGIPYAFNIAGLGVGGIGASTIDANGEVYKLRSVANFPGTYGQARYGFAIGTMSGGDLWMQNKIRCHHAPEG